MNFLLTWNCKHIANPFIADRLQSCFSSMGFIFDICTPEQFFTDDDNDSPNQPSEGRNRLTDAPAAHTFTRSSRAPSWLSLSSMDS